MFSALVIDARTSQLSGIRAALADAGCLDIEVAQGERDAVRLAADGEPRPDIILIELTDTEVGSILRLARAFRDVPIIAICDEIAIDAAFAAGAAECATKPVRARELRGRIRETLRLRSEVVGRARRERNMSASIVVLQQEKQELERLVCVDPLTGIANRRHTFTLLEAEWKRSAREHSPLGIVMIDLDCYHAYNERYGHLGGDRCLQRVTEAMAACLRRPSDFLGRYGGEEFIAVLPNTDAAGAKIVAERLRTSVAALGIPHDASACARVVTITAGFAAFRSLGDLPVDKLIATADAALLRAKASGRDRVEGDAPLVRPTRVSARSWERFAPVCTDPCFAARISPYLAELRDASRAIIEGNLEAIASMAQAMRGEAVRFGLFVIGRLLTDLDHAAAADDRARLRDIAEELLQYVTHVQVVYRRPFEPSIATAAGG